ncbi:hypothetical protein SNE40_018608 [Patella caerulea]|uniref:Uncharacterized protein n=1 Tax=Patella caerulea TaxID=87958 RepID=A0AAN8P472_PATCE
MKLILLISSAIVLIIYCDGNHTEYHALYEVLFSNGYNKYIRPVVGGNPHERLHILTSFSLLDVSDLKEHSEELATYGWLSLQWYDELLSWNPDEFNNIKDILIPQTHIWIPDIIVDNSVSSDYRLGSDKMFVRVHYNGMVVWSPSSFFLTYCAIAIQFYPFDTQTCPIIFSTEISQSNEIQLIADSEAFRMNEYNENGQWDITKTSYKELEVDHLSQIKFEIRLERRMAYHVMVIVVPTILLSVLTVMVFCLPPESGEKMTLSISVMLSFVVLLTIFSDNMSNASLDISLLAVYVLILVVLSALSTIFSVFIVNWHYKPPDSPVPKYLRWIARISCCSHSNRVRCSDSNEKSTDTKPDKDSSAEIISWSRVAVGLDRLLFIVYFSVSVAFPCAIGFLWLAYH